MSLFDNLSPAGKIVTGIGLVAAAPLAAVAAAPVAAAIGTASTVAGVSTATAIASGTTAAKTAGFACATVGNGTTAKGIKEIIEKR